MSKLTIYKASAGSGKTFRLTIEYLKIVLAQPTHYKRILAITFTNKATAEMKSRILEELHSLAQGASTAYQAVLATEMQLSIQEIQKRAAQAEQYILHDYSRFSVMTIDAFFQTIVKAFAKELGVAYNYNVELDTERIKRLSVERMFAELDENTSLRRWLQAYVEEKINNEESWNITKDILGLSKELFQEHFLLMDKKQLTQWSDKEFVKDFSNTLQSYMRAYKEELQQLGSAAMAEIAKQGLAVNDFVRKESGPAGLFYKLSQGQIFVEITSSYLHKPLDNPEGWYTKTTHTDTKQRINTLYPMLNEQLHKIHNYVNEKGRLYQSCLLVKKNLYMMAIFSDIARHIYEILNEEEKILLSESNKLLYEMIAANDVPFIYEKTGNQYLYFLWDEFQDTSQMQWHNLKPLVSNALAEGNPCLVVGDVKQAIYRWRNSDWKILEEQITTELPSQATLSLRQNWRSDTRIVRFNNELYKELPKSLEQYGSLSGLYENSEQEPYGSEEKGFVHFSYLAPNEEYNDEQLILQELPAWVEKLQQSGVKPEDIVFLVRKNSEAVAIADFFANLQERKQGVQYEVVSEHALLLQNALVVKILVCALYFFQTQEKYYAVFLEKLLPYLPQGQQKFEKWKAFVKTKKCGTSLEQLVYTIISTFSLHTLPAEQLCLMAFEEFLNTYTAEENSNLKDFLEYWEDKKYALSVTPGERIPAMRVMTVHKAKGLEFHTVILPFLHKNLNFHRNGESFWQQAEVPPMAGVGPLLLPFVKKDLLRSNFANAYEEEMHQRYIDELNVCYVGTTRAVSNLILIAPAKDTGIRISTLLYELIRNSAADSFWAQHWDEALQQWEYGKIEVPDCQESEEVLTYRQQELYYQDYLSKFPLRVSSVDDAKRKAIDRLTPIEDGKIWHRLLEDIHYIEDIPLVVKRAYYSGLITANAQQNYTTHLQELLSRETLKQYYTKAYKVLNERPVWGQEETYIPDRVVFNENEAVVIDYKFGESQSTAHKKQVAKYMQFFKEKGYTSVKGYLIYGIFSEIVLV